MPRVCCDTSCLFAVYANDVHTPTALTAAAHLGPQLVVSSFNEFEFANALRLAEFRGLLPLGPATDYFSLLQSDISAGIFRRQPCDLDAVLEESERLSALYTVRNGYRAFDIIHVAVALHLQATEFLSFDSRQRNLAHAEGLTVGS
jgi:predicted nucleic acid-binding protein